MYFFGINVTFYTISDAYVSIHHLFIKTSIVLTTLEKQLLSCFLVDQVQVCQVKRGLLAGNWFCSNYEPPGKGICALHYTCPVVHLTPPDSQDHFFNR